MTAKTWLRNRISGFRSNRSGMLLEGIICIVFIFITSIIGLVGALAVNRIADAVQPFVANDVNALTIVQNARNAYIVAIVLADILFLVYWGVVAQRKESQQQPYPVGMV